MTEIWKSHPTLKNYEASNLGRIRSTNYYNRGITKVLKQTLNNNTGYLYISISYLKRTYLSHRLIWECFNGLITEGMEIDHIDTNPLNNNLDNLRLCTHKENVNNPVTLSKRINNPKTTKPILQYSLEGVFIKEYLSAREAERCNGWNRSHISDCCLGKRNNAYGFIWKYKEVS